MPLPKPVPLGLQLRAKRDRLRLSIDQVVELLREMIQARSLPHRVDKSLISRCETGVRSMPDWLPGLYIEALQQVAIDDGVEVGLILAVGE